MSTAVELPPVDYTKNVSESQNLLGKQIESSSPSSTNDDSTASSSTCPSPGSPNAPLDKLAVKSDPSSPNAHKKKERHQNTSIHQYDSRLMGGFYEACVTKLSEVYPSWNEKWEMKDKPLYMSQKHEVHERVLKYLKDKNEPAVVLQNFDYGDILNFERFLQMLKQDGVNAISKYKQYLINKDMKKLDLDLVVIHEKYGILLVDIKECDYLDSKRRSKAKMNLNNARQSIENLVRLIVDAKGLTSEQKSEHKTEHQIPVSEIVALPNLNERPQQQQSPQQQQQQPQPAQKSTNLRQLNYLIKSDLESDESFDLWWKSNVVERLDSRKIEDKSLLNSLLGMFSCIRNNSILPIVHKEPEVTTSQLTLQTALTTITTSTTNDSIKVEKVERDEKQDDKQDDKQEKDVKSSNVESTTLIKTVDESYKLSISGEFFLDKHEKVRSLSRVIVSSKDSDRIKRTVCMQVLWLLLNDSQKKISVVCSEQNKAYYEEYFKLQRKLYNNLNNVRFYSDIKSCPINGTSHTLKKDGEIWFFDCDLDMSNNLSSEIIQRIKEFNAFWVYTQDDQWTNKNKGELDTILNLNHVNLDPEETQVQHRDGSVVTHVDVHNKPWVHGLHLKFPLRLQCDLLVIGDIVSSNQLKFLLRYFKNGGTNVRDGQHQNGYHNHNQQSQHSQAAKRLKTIKFIRGGTIDNIRTSIKMHDSIQAQVVLMHVGDEDVFKTRNSQATVDRIKELTQLVKEYCPKSFIVISTLMRRVSKSENSVINEVNKGVIQFCKQARDSSNFFYMLNNHFDPEYHTYEGRVLSNKGLKLYVDNILFVVDYFLVKNNKQH